MYATMMSKKYCTFSFGSICTEFHLNGIDIGFFFFSRIRDTDITILHTNRNNNKQFNVNKSIPYHNFDLLSLSFRNRKWQWFADVIERGLRLNFASPSYTMYDQTNIHQKQDGKWGETRAIVHYIVCSICIWYMVLASCLVLLKLMLVRDDICVLYSYFYGFLFSLLLLCVFSSLGWFFFFNLKLCINKRYTRSGDVITIQTICTL